MNQYRLYRGRILAALLAYAGIIAISCSIIQSNLFHSNSRLVWAVLFDLTVIPFGLFYYLVGRPLFISNTRLFLAFALILRLALYLLPPGLNYWLVIGSVFETLAIGVFLVRIRFFFKTYKHFKSSQNSETALKNACVEIFGSKISPFIVSELLIIYYGLFGFTLKKDTGLDSRIITTHKKSGQTALMLSILLIGIVETFIVHLLLIEWNSSIAYFILAFTLYSLLFISADLFANVKRPSYLENKTLHLRLGVRWNATIPTSEIVAVARLKHNYLRTDNGLNGMLLIKSNISISFQSGITINGPYGIKRTVSKLCIFVDDPEELVKNIQESDNAIIS